MSPVTKAPSTEAAEQIVRRLNSGQAYCLPFKAVYREVPADSVESIQGCVVDVVHETEEQLEDTIELECRTSHVFTVLLRRQLSSRDADSINTLKLLARQIWQRLNNFDSEDGRVRIWECNPNPEQNPAKGPLRELNLFVSSLTLRVEVEPA